MQINETEFTSDVTKIAEQLFFDALMQDAKAGLPDHDRPEVTAESTHALRAAEDLVQSKDILQRLCPALLTVSDDIREIAKAVSAALLPLALANASIPLVPIAFAAVSVVVARAGISSLCKSTRGPARTKADS